GAWGLRANADQHRGGSDGKIQTAPNTEGARSVAHLIPHLRRTRDRGQPPKHRRRAATVASLLSIGMIVCMASASAEPRESAADDDASQSTVPADSSAGPEVDGLEEHDGSITIREAGSVVDAMYIRGAINVQADDVTIKNSVVSYGGYHSIRIFPGADGTRILDTDVYCLKPHTNGVVFGNYYAENVALHDCRNDFMFSGGSPAQIVTSSIDGVPYVSDTAGDWSNPTPVPKPEASEEPSGEPAEEPSGEPTQEPSAEASATTDFPDADSTGVPDGVSLTASGSLNITKDGTVVDGLHVRGTITKAADD